MAIQILKLGLTGSEITLPVKSRTNSQGADTPFFNESRSADKTLHTDFINTKENHSIAWAVISVSDYTIINNIVKLQYTDGVNLSFIYTNSAGLETQIDVRATVTNKGELVQVGDWYYNEFGLLLEQV